MTGIGVYMLFKKLGWSRLEAAAHLGVNEKTIRRWSSTGAPPHASRLLSHLAAGQLTAAQVKAALKMDFERRPAA